MCNNNSVKFFLSEKTQTENKRLRLPLQQKIEAANQILREQEVECNQLMQQMNQLDTGIEYDDFPSKAAQLTSFNIKKCTTVSSCKI